MHEIRSVYSARIRYRAVHLDETKLLLLNAVADFETQTRFMRQWQSGHWVQWYRTPSVRQSAEYVWVAYQDGRHARLPKARLAEGYRHRATGITFYARPRPDLGEGAASEPLIELRDAAPTSPKALRLRLVGRDLLD